MQFGTHVVTEIIRGSYRHTWGWDTCWPGRGSAADLPAARAGGREYFGFWWYAPPAPAGRGGHRSSPWQSAPPAGCRGDWAPASVPGWGSLLAGRSASCCGDLETSASGAWESDKERKFRMSPTKPSRECAPFGATEGSREWRAVTWWAGGGRFGCGCHRGPGSWGRAG